MTKNNNFYIYDGFSNAIFNISADKANEIKNYINFDREMILESLNENDKQVAIKYELFKEFDKKNLTINAKEEILKYGNPQLILGVTENCNLRCKYCIFSDQYAHTRKHDFGKMSFDVAKNSIDYFIDLVEEGKRMNPLKEPIISFYGGEPLLEFDLLKKAVNYVKSKKIKVTFGITTNGVLMTDEIAEFLISNNFYVSVSLDGSEGEHDKNRVDLYNRGTFKKVMNCLETLDYYIKKQKKESELFIIVLSCYDFDTNFAENKEFFTNLHSTYFIPFNKISKIVDVDTHRSDSMDKTDLNHAYSTYVSDLLQKGKGDIYYEGIFGQFLKTIYGRNITPGGRSFSRIMNGSCIPGSKIFVSVDGDFHICEKMSYNFKIGDYLNGLDYIKISDIINDFRKKVVRKCNKCPYTSLCGICFANCETDKEFDIEKHCGNKPSIIESHLSTLYTILESNSASIENLFSGRKHNLSIDKC